MICKKLGTNETQSLTTSTNLRWVIPISSKLALPWWLSGEHV